MNIQLFKDPNNNMAAINANGNEETSSSPSSASRLQQQQQQHILHALTYNQPALV